MHVVKYERTYNTQVITLNQKWIFLENFLNKWFPFAEESSTYKFLLLFTTTIWVCCERKKNLKEKKFDCNQLLELYICPCNFQFGSHIWNSLPMVSLPQVSCNWLSFTVPVRAALKDVCLSELFPVSHKQNLCKSTAYILSHHPRQPIQLCENLSSHFYMMW